MMGCLVDDGMPGGWWDDWWLMGCLVDEWMVGWMVDDGMSGG